MLHKVQNNYTAPRQPDLLQTVTSVAYRQSVSLFKLFIYSILPILVVKKIVDTKKSVQVHIFFFCFAGRLFTPNLTNIIIILQFMNVAAHLNY